MYNNSSRFNNFPPPPVYNQPTGLCSIRDRGHNIFGDEGETSATTATPSRRKRWLFTEGLQSLTARRKIGWLTRNASTNTSLQMEWTTLENRAILLSGCGAKAYKLIKSLIAPAKPTDKTFQQLVSRDRVETFRSRSSHYRSEIQIQRKDPATR